MFQDVIWSMLQYWFISNRDIVAHSPRELLKELYRRRGQRNILPISDET